ncbi:DUF4397 domain-containing protein [Demequina zhanjiangensis]|uniref:DUF4397 domain-containing protein n=1 Tax=Demequina zhanjiangensis TaxID=3051659 RepID=A0ABT8G4S2_9MICO|nr:DUF4397 domain-containing protein [Demequina sp. SYSU T00b26]MDN4474057.1 DUF4397 domain-containing protein [Demequina sp. SYSU T00b26]
MRKSLIAGAAAGALLAASAAPAMAVEDGKADLSVLHGIPDLTVDVYVNGDLTLDDFAPGDLAGPLSLDPGTYSVAITASDAADDSSPVLGPIDLPLEEGMSYTAVAHLDEAGDPTASLFTNDISATAAGEGRLTVRHTAAAPGVDVWADGSVVFEDLMNPDEVMADLPAATYEAAVSVAGETDPVLGPADVMIEDGVNTIVYAWGSAADDSLALAVQTVDTHASSPSGVPTGTQGLAADSEGVPAAAIAISLAALAAAGVTVRFVTARR